MAPKKKGNKKANDDWEAELGETVDPIAAATQESKDEDAAEENEDGGGLLAALRKNKGKKAKKGKVPDDILEGEDPPGTNGVDGTDASQPVDLTAKAPQEANLDEDDMFSQPVKKPKGGKADKPVDAEEPPEDEDDEEGGGRVKTKKEKEKDRKEREKQRKKENVRFSGNQSSIFNCRSSFFNMLTPISILGRKEEDCYSHTCRKARARSNREKKGRACPNS